jgi:catechol 2,3-dioxygenase
MQPEPIFDLAHLLKRIVWTEEERKKGQAWGLKTIESFHAHGTPPVAHK